MLLRLQNSIIYGPVNSRRLGRSLGVNLLPFHQKTCTLDCLYCQYGWTRFSYLETARYPEGSGVLAALQDSLTKLTEPPAYITFSGNGEPTLHPEFGRIVDEVKKVRDVLAPRARVAVLSNATTVTRVSVRQALSRLDDRIMKLDAGNAGTFEMTNRPHPVVDYRKMINALAALDKVTIQSLFTQGKHGNMTPAAITDWIDKIVAINPLKVQIYTLDRAHPAPTIEAADRTELEQIKKQVENKNIPAEVY